MPMGIAQLRPEARKMAAQSDCRQGTADSFIDEIEVFEKRQGKQSKQYAYCQCPFRMFGFDYEKSSKVGHGCYGKQNNRVDGLPLQIKQITHKEKIYIP